jgi:hypothetical protein
MGFFDSILMFGYGLIFLASIPVVVFYFIKFFKKTQGDKTVVEHISSKETLLCFLGIYYFYLLLTGSFKFANIISSTISVLLLFGLLHFSIIIAKNIFSKKEEVDYSTRKSHLRGTELFNDDAGNSESSINEAILKNQISFAGFSFKESIEPKHFVAMGSTGTGKSSAIKELVYTTQKRQDRHVISDADFGYANQFMMENDVLLNPFDSRSANWDYLSEIQSPSDYMFLASMIVPLGKKDDEWRKYARQLLSSASEGWKKNELGVSSEFFNFLTSAKTFELGVLCEGTAAARFFEKGNEKMLGGVLGTLAPFIEPLKFLGNSDNSQPFSIREWIKNGSGTLYLPYKANQIASIQSLISTWLGLSIYETLSLEPSNTRRIWFIADEVDAIGRIEGLKDALVRLRKFGGRVVLGFQSISQLSLVYGDLEANTIIENCGNKLILRCDISDKGGTAEFASRLIGERDVELISHTSSYSDQGSGGSWNKSERKENVVLASEITKLKDLEGYLRVANNENWYKVNFQHIDYSNLTQ